MSEENNIKFVLYLYLFSKSDFIDSGVGVL